MPWCVGQDALVSTPVCVLMEDEYLYNDDDLDFLNAVPNADDLQEILQKKVTNVTYLKSMYINQKFTRSFIPSFDDIFNNKATKFHTQHVTLMNAAGKTWGVDFEIVKSGKQMHCRLARGWRLFCHDNEVALNDCLVFQRIIFDGQCTLLVSICKA